MLGGGGGWVTSELISFRLEGDWLKDKCINEPTDAKITLMARCQQRGRKRCDSRALYNRESHFVGSCCTRAFYAFCVAVGNNRRRETLVDTDTLHTTHQASLVRLDIIS